MKFSHTGTLTSLRLLPTAGNLYLPPGILRIPWNYGKKTETAQQDTDAPPTEEVSPPPPDDNKK
jgi:hypothetical protein